MPKNKSIEKSQILQHLFEERKMTKDRLLQIDKMVFQFVTVILSPILILSGYSLYNFGSKFKYALLIVPYFLVLAVLIMSLFYMHHAVCDIYNIYLSKQINNIIKKPRFCLEEMDYFYFVKDFGVQHAMFVLAGTFLLVFVLILIPFLNITLKSLTECTFFPVFIRTHAKFIYWSGLVFILNHSNSSTY